MRTISQNKFWKLKNAICFFILLFFAFSNPLLAQDTDGDGYMDTVDLDDDNDGILDCDESISHESGDVLTLNTSTATGTITDNINLGGTVNFTFTSAASDLLLAQSKTDGTSIFFQMLLEE